MKEEEEEKERAGLAMDLVWGSLGHSLRLGLGLDLTFGIGLGLGLRCVACRLVFPSFSNRAELSSSSQG